MVKVAFYLGINDPLQIECLRLAIQSVRETMPKAEVIHLTMPSGPHIPEADKRIETPKNGTYGLCRAQSHSMVDGDVLFLGSDVICREDVSDVFNQDFDVAIATDMKPGSPDIKYNAEIMFSRCPEFWKDIQETLKDLDFGPGSDWHPIEKAYTDLIDSGKYKVLILPGEEYNYVPSHENDHYGRLTHYRGQRKQWMPRPITYENTLNNSPEVMIEQFRQNIKRDLPFFNDSKPRNNSAIIVGGGPSLNDCLTKLRFHKDRGGEIFALNNTRSWLTERGIKPDYHVMLDSREDDAEFVKNPDKDVKYLISAYCHPKVFENLEGYDVTLWMSDMDGVMPIVQEIQDKPVCLVGGGATVGLKTMYLCYLMGYRKFHFFGFDSSYRDGNHHAYPQPMNNRESRIQVTAAGKHFICAPWMAKQATEFQGQARKLSQLGCKLTVHGDGLIPWIMQYQEQSCSQHQQSKAVAQT